MVSAATVAPVGMKVSPLIASAERWIGSRNLWSGIRARLSHDRQKRMVVSMRAAAASASSGATRPSSQERTQYARSPAWSTCRPRTRFSSIPSGRLDARRNVCPAPLASAA